MNPPPAKQEESHNSSLLSSVKSTMQENISAAGVLLQSSLANVGYIMTLSWPGSPIMPRPAVSAMLLLLLVVMVVVVVVLLSPPVAAKDTALSPPA